MNQRAWPREVVACSRAAIVLTACLALIGLTSSGGVQAQAKPIPGTIPDPSVTGNLAVVSPEGGALVQPGPPPDIILLYTGRAVGYVEPCG